VANGSGDASTLSGNLAQIAASAEPSLRIEPFVWSHGSGRSITDHLDHDNQVSQGRRLASQVTAYSRRYPDHHIYLVGHSTGCAVVLMAAESLSPGTIEGIALLAPSVSADHDLRQTLRSTRAGVHVHCSAEDRWILGFGMKILGTSDLNYSDAAGLYGFRLVSTSPDDAALYQKLHQHPWDSTVAWTGNNGSHYGCIQPEFLKAYVLPDLVR
jgi:pimeloyl-ACP methyl ester carboxylesterase